MRWAGVSLFWTPCAGVIEGAADAFELLEVDGVIHVDGELACRSGAEGEGGLRGEKRGLIRRGLDDLDDLRVYRQKGDGEKRGEKSRF
jgi:hypothetical protein